MSKKMFLLVVAVLLVPATIQASIIPVTGADLLGFRDTSSGVVAADGWNAAKDGFKIAWNIGLSGGVWNYQYTFTDADGTPIKPDVSHWILEVSPGIDANNVESHIFNPNFALVDPQTWTADPLSPGNTSPGGNNGNPNLPADLYGIKLDTGSDVVGGVYTFQSDKAPVWGDFYTKDGKHGGVVAVAWNSGIGTDPTGSTTDFTPWIPTPDTNGLPPQAVPEASSLVLLGLSALGLGIVGWRRRRTTD